MRLWHLTKSSSADNIACESGCDSAETGSEAHWHGAGAKKFRSHMMGLFWIQDLFKICKDAEAWTGPNIRVVSTKGIRLEEEGVEEDCW